MVSPAPAHSSDAALDGRLYFDITDIVDYAHGHNRVSGIQRVVINVICDAAAKYGSERVRCLYYHRGHKSFFECSAAAFAHQGEFDLERLLFKLGFLRNWKIFPSRMRVKAHLKRFRDEGDELGRSLRKIDIYLSSILWSGRLREFDLQRICDQFDGQSQVAVQRFAGFTHADSLLMLGANWNCEPMFDLAKEHADAGGDVVQMVYDLIPHLYPQYFPAKHTEVFLRWLELATGFKSRYVCISECTAKDLRQFLQVKGIGAQVVAVRLAHEMVGFPRNANIDGEFRRLQELHGKNYVLCVGTIEIRKNGPMLLRAWMKLLEKFGPQLPLLVFAGRRGWLIEEFDSLLADPRLNGAVRIIESPSDGELAFLYRNSFFTVFPSVYEGWGLPVGEAAWFGKACVASNTSSIPEVCGDLIDYMNPHDLADMVNVLSRSLSDPESLNQREEKIKSSVLRTWRDVAEDICGFSCR